MQDYVINKKSALDWVVEHCGISVDKDSQIINDFNNMAEKMGDPQVYPAPDSEGDHSEPRDQQDCDLAASTAYPRAGSLI